MNSTMSLVFEKAIACAELITKKLHDSGNVDQVIVNEKLGLRDLVFTSDRYRRAHHSVIDARENKKIWLLHVTIFPHINDPSPIYGFDIIAGPNKVSGAFHDFSNVQPITHPLSIWFKKQTDSLTWNKKRELPDWAKQIFSDNMVAIGAVGSEELDLFTSLGLTTLDYFLANLGHLTDGDYTTGQNKYCHFQKQNPHTVRALVNLGFTEQEANDFIQNNQFPELIQP